MIGAELALVLALAQQPRTVALVIDGRTQIVFLVSAQREFRKLDSLVRDSEQEKRHAALVVALGTLEQPRVECMRGVRENWFGELFVCGN